LVDQKEKMAKVRAAKKPAQNKSIHPNVLELDDEHPLTAKNVKDWINWNKDKLPELKRAARMKEKGSIAKLADIESYIRNLNGYLRGGQWVDDFYGREQERKIKWVTIVPKG
jgi:hypothetical protein